MLKTILRSILALAVTSCTASESNITSRSFQNDRSESPSSSNTIAAVVETEEQIDPIDSMYPDINDPGSALFYDNMGTQAYYRDSKQERREDLDLAYRSISIALKLYRAAGKAEDYQRMVDLKKQIVAARSAAKW